MTPGIKKAASGKKMRVATMFTGAVACTAAFAPSAAGATGNDHQAQTDGKATLTQARDTPTVVQAGGFKSGSIKVNSGFGCEPLSHWMHLEFDGGGVVNCFGYKGTIAFSTYRALEGSLECGGNNHGLLVSESGRSWGFGPGTRYATLPFPTRAVRVIQMFSWTGHDACPFQA